MKEVALWIVIGVFLATWIAFANYAARKEWSKTVGWGGGFLIACVVFSVIGIAVMATSGEQHSKIEHDAIKVTATDPVKDQPSPVRSLDVKAAASHAKADLRLIEVALDDLKSAVETTDRAGFRKYVTAPLFEASVWWDDYEYPSEFNSCKAALGHAHSYAMTMWEEYLSGSAHDGVWNRKSRDMADRNLKDARRQCREAIRMSGRA